MRNEHTTVLAVSEFVSADDVGVVARLNLAGNHCFLSSVLHGWTDDRGAERAGWSNLSGLMGVAYVLSRSIHAKLARSLRSGRQCMRSLAHFWEI